MSALKADINHLFDQATVKLVGATQAGLKGELFDVLHEFFSTTSSWQETIPVNVVANTTQYSLVPAEGGKIIRLIAVVDGNGTGQPAVLEGFDSVLFHNAYSSAAAFQAQVVKTVIFPTQSDDIPDMPEWLLQVWPLVILDGLLGKMMGHAGKSYSNVALSVYHLRRFRDGMATVTTATLRRNTEGTRTWGFPQTFKSNSQRTGISTSIPRF